MKTLKQVLEIPGTPLKQSNLQHYIEESWILPEREGASWLFDELDVARAHLVHHLQQDLLVDDETMDLVLSLIDQMYGLREQMRQMLNAFAEQPDTVKNNLLPLLRKISE